MSTLEDRGTDLERSATGNSAGSGAGSHLSLRGFGVGGSGGGGRVGGRSKRGLSKDNKKSGRSFSLPHRRGRSSKRSGADGTTTAMTRDRDGDGGGSDGRPSGAPSSSEVAGSGGGGLDLNGFLKDISALDVQAEAAARSGSAAKDDPFARGTDGEKLLMRFRSKKLLASQRGLESSLDFEVEGASAASEEKAEAAARSGSAANDAPFARGTEGEKPLMGFRSKKLLASQRGFDSSLDFEVEGSSVSSEEEAEALRSGSAANDDPFARGTAREKPLMGFRSTKLMAFDDSSQDFEEEGSSSSPLEEEEEKAEIGAGEKQAEDRGEEDLSPDNDIPRDVLAVNGDPAIIPGAHRGGNDGDDSSGDEAFAPGAHRGGNDGDDSSGDEAFAPGLDGDESNPRIRSRDDGLALPSGADAENESSSSDSSSDAFKDLSEDYVDHEEEEEERARRRDVWKVDDEDGLPSRSSSHRSSRPEPTPTSLSTVPPPSSYASATPISHRAELGNFYQDEAMVDALIASAGARGRGGMSHRSGRGLNGAAYEDQHFEIINREAKSKGGHQSRDDDASSSRRRSSSVPRPRRGLSLNRRSRRARSVEKPKKEQQGGTSTRSAGGGLFKSLRSLGGGRGGQGGKASKSAAASIGSSSSAPPPISTIEFGVATTPKSGPAAPAPPLSRVEAPVTVAAESVPLRPTADESQPRGRGTHERPDDNRGDVVREQAATTAPPPLTPVSEAVAHADARNASGTLPPTLSASMAAVLADEAVGSIRTSVTTTTTTAEERAPPPPATDALTTPESLAPKGQKKTKIEKINELKAFNKQLRRDNKTLHLQLREAESRASQMEDSNAALRSSRLELLAKAEAERAKSERSTAEADELRRRYERIKDELDETLDDVDRLEEERDESRSLIKRLDREASKLSDGAEAARNEALRLAAELRAKEMESDNAAMELKIRDAELRAKDEAIEELRAQLEEARAKPSATVENGDGGRSGLVERGSSARDGVSASDTREASSLPIDRGGGGRMRSIGKDVTHGRETRRGASERVVGDLDFYGRRETDSDARRASAARNNFRNIGRKTASMRR